MKMMSELRIKKLREELADRVVVKVCKMLREMSLNRVTPEVCKIIAEKCFDRVLARVYEIMTEKFTDRVLPRACKILTEELKDVELLVAKVYTDLVSSHVGEFAKRFITGMMHISACELVTEEFFANMFPEVCGILVQESIDQVLLPEVWELMIGLVAYIMLPGVCEDLLKKLQEEDYIVPLMREVCDSVMKQFKEYVETKHLPKAGSHKVGEMQVVAEGAEVTHNTVISPAVSAFDLNVAYDEIHGSTSSVTVATSIHSSPRALLQPPPTKAVHSGDTPTIISPTTQDLASTDAAVRSNTLDGELAGAAGLIPSFPAFDLNVALDEVE